MEEDAAADRPFIAALAISKARDGLPAPGFFDCAGRLGRFADRQDARTFHAAELMPSSLAGAVRATTSDEDTLFTETNPPLTRGGGLCRPPQSHRLASMSGSGYPKFRNDRGVPEICIGGRSSSASACPRHRPPAHLHRYARGGHYPLSLLATRFRFDLD